MSHNEEWLATDQTMAAFLDLSRERYVYEEARDEPDWYEVFDNECDARKWCEARIDGLVESGDDIIVIDNSSFPPAKSLMYHMVCVTHLADDDDEVVLKRTTLTGEWERRIREWTKNYWDYLDYADDCCYE